MSIIDDFAAINAAVHKISDRILDWYPSKKEEDDRNVAIIFEELKKPLNLSYEGLYIHRNKHKFHVSKKADGMFMAVLIDSPARFFVTAATMTELNEQVQRILDRFSLMLP